MDNNSYKVQFKKKYRLKSYNLVYTKYFVKKINKSKKYQ